MAATIDRLYDEWRTEPVRPCLPSSSTVCRRAAETNSAHGDDAEPVSALAAAASAFIGLLISSEYHSMPIISMPGTRLGRKKDGIPSQKFLGEIAADRRADRGAQKLPTSGKTAHNPIGLLRLRAAAVDDFSVKGEWNQACPPVKPCMGAQHDHLPAGFCGERHRPHGRAPGKRVALIRRYLRTREHLAPASPPSAGITTISGDQIGGRDPSRPVIDGPAADSRPECRQANRV